MKIKKHHLLTINKLLIEVAVAIGFTLIIWLIYVSVSVAHNKVQIGSSYMTMTILVPSLWAAAIALLSLGDFPSTGLRIIALTCLLTKE